MLRRVNDLLATVDGRYRVEERQEGLVGKPANTESSGEVHSLPAGQQILISQAAALVADEIIPATPPLIGDTMFGRVDSPIRKKIFEVIQGADRQVLLFAIEHELEGLKITPCFRLKQSEDGRSSEIVIK